jgi:hypothetical protein
MNQAVVNAVQRAANIQAWVDALSPRRGGSERINEYMDRFRTKNQGQKLTDTELRYAQTYATTKWAAELKQEEKVEKKKLTPVERAADATKGTAFSDLDTDVAEGWYRVERAGSKKIQQSSGLGGGKEIKFSDYAEGKSPEDAVEEAIMLLDVSGSANAAHARADEQDSSPGTVNLQVQLGGSAGNYRKGKGDTSWTLVTVDEDLFRAMRAANSVRWRLVLQAAHRESLETCQAIRIRRPPG